LHCTTRDLRLIKATSPRGTPGAPEEGGERYRHFEEIAGALRAQIFGSELMHIGFQRILEVSRVGSLEIGVRRWIALHTSSPWD
jgi:hypothetical protein